MIQWSHMSSNNTHNYPITLIIPPVSSTSTAPSIISDEVIIIWHAASSLSVHSGRFAKMLHLILTDWFIPNWETIFEQKCVLIRFYLVIISGLDYFRWSHYNMTCSMFPVCALEFAKTRKFPKPDPNPKIGVFLLCTVRDLPKLLQFYDNWLRYYSINLIHNTKTAFWRNKNASW